MKVVDVSTPTSPAIAWHESLAGGARTDIVVADDNAYVLGSSLKVMDVTDPTRPISQFSLNSDSYEFKSVAAAQEYLYLATGEAGLRIVNISNPITPIEVNTLFALTP